MEFSSLYEKSENDVINLAKDDAIFEYKKLRHQVRMLRHALQFRKHQIDPNRFDKKLEYFGINKKNVEE